MLNLIMSLLVVISISSTSNISFEKIWSLDNNKSIVDINNKVIIRTKVEKDGISDFINPVDRKQIAQEEDYIISTLTDNDFVYYLTERMQLKRLDLSNNEIITLTDLSRDDYKVIYIIAIHNNNLIFSTGKFIYFINKESGKIEYKLTALYTWHRIN